MRYAIFSDIHSNFEALTAVLDFLKVNPVDKIICCGDIIGYGPSPHECIEKISVLPNFVSILGNHDAALIGKISQSNFNATAQAALEINRKAMSGGDSAYLSSLRDSISENDILFVHGSPRDHVNEYLFLMDKFKENLDAFRERVCFVGHTHHPLLYQYEYGSGEDTCLNIDEDMEVFTLSTAKRYIINVGSVGQPRDFKPSSSLVFFDTKSQTLTFRRVQYNVKATQAKMKALGIPVELIQRIETGT